MLKLKKISAIAILLLCNMNAHAEITQCVGTFENGHPVCVKIDWDSEEVIVNNTRTEIHSSNVGGTGITTERHVNTFGDEYCYGIAYQDGRNWLVQFMNPNNLDHISHYAELHCSKPFVKPFMTRMLTNT